MPANNPNAYLNTAPSLANGITPIQQMQFGSMPDFRGGFGMPSPTPAQLAEVAVGPENGFSLANFSGKTGGFMKGLLDKVGGFDGLTNMAGLGMSLANFGQNRRLKNEAGVRAEGAYSNQITANNAAEARRARMASQMTGGNAPAPTLFT